MKNTVKFNDFMDGVQTWANGNHDDLSTSADWAFTAGGRPATFGQMDFTPEGAGGLFSGVNVRSGGRLTQYAFGQACGRFNVPSQWAMNPDACPDELLNMVMNWKFANTEEKRYMVRQRTQGDENLVRGIMSDEYVPFDHIEIMNSVAKIMQENDIPVEVFRPEVGDTMRAYLLIGDGYIGGGPDTKDGGLRPAVHIWNDEVGRSALHIDAALWRQVCTNGALAVHTGEDRFRIIHRWSTKPMLHTLVNEALAVAFKLSHEAAVKFLQTQNQTIQLTSLKDIVNSWSNTYKLPDTFKTDWETAVKVNSTSERLTLWDVINGATAIARDIENADVRQTAETMAGAMIFDPRR